MIKMTKEYFGRRFFIADTHFGSDNIIRYENRPFDSSAEMDKTLINNWNKTVNNGDTVFVLGDFCESDDEKRILSKLNGTKILIRGNHDFGTSSFYRKAGFEDVYDMPVLYDGFFMLSHQPLYVNSNMPYANIFGHVHNNPMFKDYSKQHFCVSAERINYTPISYSEILGKIDISISK
jgi:phosphoesterase